MPISTFLRVHVQQLLDADDGGTSKAERVVDAGLLVLVLINALAVVLESVPSLHLAYKPYFTLIELVSVYLFTLEYVLRLWSAVENRRYRHP
jgi:voltage-gated potassium channel